MVVELGILFGVLTYWLEKHKPKHTKGAVMTDAVAQELEKQATPSEMIVIGSTSIHNTQLVSKEFLGILEYILVKMEPEHTLFSIVLDNTSGLKDGEGEPLYAQLMPKTHSVIISLLHHFNSAYDTISEIDEKMGYCPVAIRTVIWHSLLITIFHEIHHAKRYAENVDIEWTDEEEGAANDYADWRIEALAKECIIELPAKEDDTFFFKTLIELREVLTDAKEEWADHQVRMFDEGIVSSTKGIDEEGVDIMTFKEFIRLQSTDPKNADWAKTLMPEIIPTGTPLPDTTSVGPTPEMAAAALCHDNTDVGVPWVEGNNDGDIMDQFANEILTPSSQVAPTETMVLPITTFNGVKPENFSNPVTAAMAGGGTVTSGVPGGQQGDQALVKVTPPTISLAEQMEIVKTINMRLYVHIFTKCGFNPVSPTSFDNPGAIGEPVFVGDIPNIQQIFLSMNTVDTKGVRQNDVQISDQIKGQVFSKSGLPGYWLYLNTGGFKVKRVLVPQNPNKMKNGAIAPYAQNARNGWAVCWFIGNHPITGAGQMMAKIETQPSGVMTYIPKPFGDQ